LKTLHRERGGGDIIEMNIKANLRLWRGFIWLKTETVGRCGLCNDGGSRPDYITWNFTLAANNELEMMYHDVVVATFEVFFKISLGEHKDYNESLQSVLQTET
jgi:hypothetical protein